MANRLKVHLKGDAKSKDPNLYTAEIVSEATIDFHQIIQELVDAGLIEVDVKQAIEIITLFNKKTAEFVTCGHSVDTGLVKLSPEIRGIVIAQVWNPRINKIDVSMKNGSELMAAIKNTTVEVHSVETSALTNQKDEIGKEEAKNPFNQDYLKFENDDPACGIAFRKWLSK